ncbi:MAG: rod-binding protein [Clostridiales bacterium]|nr:rod-binding protein [Clostridiales bacterium]
MKIDNITASAQVQQATQKENVSSSGFDKILEEAKKSGDTTELRKATDELEAIFIDMMMKSMRSTITETDGIFKKSESEKMFQEMLDEEYSKTMVEAGGIGISDMIFKQFEQSMASEDDEPATTFEMKG